MDLSLVIQLIVIACLWGGTNPFIKKGSKGIEKVGCCDNFLSKFLKEISFLILNWKYLVPFGLNQLGSILFFFILQKYDLTIIVPVTNSLSYAFTYLVGYLVGESKPNARTILGMLLIVAGTTCFVLSKTDDCNDGFSNCDKVV